MRGYAALSVGNTGFALRPEGFLLWGARRCKTSGLPVRHVFLIPQVSGQKRMGPVAGSAMVGLSGFFPGGYFEFPLL